MACQGTALKSSCDIFLSALHLRPQVTSGPLLDVLLMVLMNEETENISWMAALC
jgi:hypothetical protein